MPFDDLRESQWLAQFYSLSKVLLNRLDKNLEFLFGTEEAKTAEILIAALKDKAANSVIENIDEHRATWTAKSKEERDKLIAQAAILANRHEGHRMMCPSCGSEALLYGNLSGSPKVEVQDQTIIEKKPILPSAFECFACSLKISGYSKLSACGLGDSYTRTSRFDAAVYLGVSIEDEWAGMDEDNNDP